MKIDSYKINKQVQHLLVIVLLLASSISAQYYVSSASELNAILTNLVPGDTVIMANGTWTNQHVIFDAIGAENDSIVLKAETPGHVILTGTSTLRIRGKYLKVDGLRFVDGYSSDDGVIEFRRGSSKAYHSRLTNTSIVNYNPENSTLDYKWVSIYGENNRVDHCYFEGKENNGATLVVWVTPASSPNFHRIDHNYFAYREDLGRNGGETIRIGDSGNSIYNSNSIVEYNYFEHCDGEIEIISSKSDDNIYRYNTFFESAGMLTLRHGDSCSVYGNFFIGNNKARTGGVRIIGAGHKVYNNYFENLQGGQGDWRAALTMMNGVLDSPLNRYFQVESAEVMFNTFVNCYSPFLIGAGANTELSLPPKDCLIANNAVYSDQQVITYTDTPINMTYDGNVMMGSALGIDPQVGIKWVDPLFEVASDSIYRPASGSPLIDSASGVYSLVDMDIDGQQRDLNKDIGADEVSSDPKTIFPVTAANVGPIWLSDDVPVGISIEINGGGTIQYNPEGGVYDLGTVVELTAVPNNGSTFDSWSGFVSSTENPITVIIEDGIELIANFIDPNFYGYTLWKTGQGSVQTSPNQDEFAEGSEVIFTAIPSEGWQFSKWNGSLTGSQNPDTLIIDSEETIQVIFELITAVEEYSIPTEFMLNQNYPNPFNPTTQISYSLKETANTNITIYSVLGNIVDVLVNENKQAGNYSFNYDASQLTSGVYFVRFIASDFTDTKKMILNK